MLAQGQVIKSKNLASFNLIVVSRNYESYLCGHSVYAWHFCHYLLQETECNVTLVMHGPDDGPRHSKQICPPIEHERFRQVIVGSFSHGKLPNAYKPCLVADAVDGVLEGIHNGAAGQAAVFLICPFLFAADLIAVTKFHKVQCYSSMRGTDLLILKKQAFRCSPEGRRYHRALCEMDGVYVQGEWMQGQSEALGIPTEGLLQTIVDLPPFMAKDVPLDLEATWANWCQSVGFNPADERPMVCYVGRLSPEKGAGQIARTFATLLNRCENVRVLVAGSGPMEAEVREIVPEIPGRSTITPLSIFEVFAVAAHCGRCKGRCLLMTAPGLGGDFQEALGSTYIYFSSNGVPVLFPVDGNTGGLLECVSPQNTEWCREVGLPADNWPERVSEYFEGKYDGLELRQRNIEYSARFKADVQLMPRVLDWAE